MNSISLKELAERMQLVDYTPEIPLEDIEITTAELNRPALQLTGFMEHFLPCYYIFKGVMRQSFFGNSKKPCDGSGYPSHG